MSSTLSTRIAPPALALNLTLLVGLVANLFLTTLTSIHMVLGAAVTGLVLAHLWAHRGRTSPARRVTSGVVLVLLTALTAVTGVLTWQNVDGATSWHGYAALALVVLALGHAWRRVRHRTHTPATDA